MFPLLILAVGAVLLAHSSKLAALWKANFSDADFKSVTSEARTAFGGGLEPVATLSAAGLAKLRSKLSRQAANVAEPMTIVVLGSGHQAAFYEAAPGSPEPLGLDSAHAQICDALQLAEENYGGGAELYLSPMKVEDDGAEWVAGFALTTGQPDPTDFLEGGALQGCIRAGNLGELRSAKFCD